MTASSGEILHGIALARRIAARIVEAKAAEQTDAGAELGPTHAGPNRDAAVAVGTKATGAGRPEQARDAFFDDVVRGTGRARWHSMTTRARPLPSNSRKLLVAAIGVAAVNYVACSSQPDFITSGNLMGPTVDASSDDAMPPFPTSGNLMAPADSSVIDSATDAGTDANDGDGAADAADGDASP